MSCELFGGFLRQDIRGILGMQRLAGRVAVVTGAADGIGRAVAMAVESVASCQQPTKRFGIRSSGQSRLRKNRGLPFQYDLRQGVAVLSF